MLQSHIAAITLLWAIFTIAISFTPLESLVAQILKRYPTARDMRMIRTMFLVVAFATLALLLYYFLLVVADIVIFISPVIVSLIHSPLPILSSIFIGISVLCCLLIAITLFVKYLWSVVIRLTVENDEIERRAYFIWEKEGRLIGHDLEYWIRAKNEWKAERRQTHKKRRWLWIK